MFGAVFFFFLDEMLSISVRMKESESQNKVEQIKEESWWTLGFRVLARVLNGINDRPQEAAKLTGTVQPANDDFDNRQTAELSIHLEEYKQLSEEIKLRVDFQQKLTHYQLLSGGIVATIGIRITQLEPEQISQSESVRFYLILSPIIFLVFSWMFSNSDIMIISVAEYINRQLKPKLQKLLNRPDILEFESFMSENRRTLIKRYGLLALFGQEFTMLFILPILFVSIYFFVFHGDISSIARGNILIRFSQFILLLGTLVVYLKTLLLRRKVWSGYLAIDQENSRD